MNIAVIGAGASGLCSLRYILENGDKFNGVIFEQMDSIGGTWVYTENVGVDKFGVPIHTSMYKNLRTNLPKESMQFPYFNFKEHKQSYVPREVILEYLNDYASAYNLRGHIKLNHCVKKISPEGKKWNIIVKNLKENREEFYEFDAVIIGSGHNSCAVYPEIKGIETFKGTQIHSHDYRVPEKYKDQIVLVIGAGPSGLDIIDDISKTAKKIIWSHHSERIQGNIFPDVLKKPDVISATGNTIEFKDGTTCEVESIIFCTGYRFSYPFLTESCGISTADNYVRPLYKQIININHPTMGFIGIPKLTPQFPLFDIQVRYFLKMLIIGLPTKETMFQDLDKFEKSKSDLKLPKKCYPVLYNDTEQYRNDLVKEAMIDPVPEILMKMHDKAIDFVLTDFQNFRKNIFKVINENDFEIRELDK